MKKILRDDFPFFNFNENEKIYYLDSAATTQKPKIVIDAIAEYYTKYNANANRGAYKLASKSTDILEESRLSVKKFINAKLSEEIIFTKSATEALNLISYSFGLKNLKEDDEVLISICEHHSNLVNWQFICEQTGAKLKFFYLNDDLEFDMQDFKNKLNKKTKIVAFTGQSNVIPFNVDIKTINELAHSVGAVTVLDATQLIAHKSIDVQNLDIDFLAFSGHKIFSAQGVGVLYINKRLFDNINPFLLGGDMIEYVSEEKSYYAQLPHKFEAGTLDIAAIYSLQKAIEYINKIGYEKIYEIESSLMKYLIEKIEKLDFLEIYIPKNKTLMPILSFNVKNVHPHDVSQILDFYNVCIRVGHHCAQPLHKYLGLNSTCRISLSIYNTKEDIDRCIFALNKVREIFYGN